MTKEYCVIWCRVSTDRQAKEGISLEAQETFLRKYADENKLIPLKIFSCGESGYKEVRKEFDSMLNWTRANEVKILLTEKQDRYSRRSKEDFIESLKSVCDEFELSEIHFPKDGKVWKKDKGWTAGEKFQARVMSAVSTYKSDIISDEVKKAQLEKVENGFYPGKVPMGYRNTKKALDEYGEKFEKLIMVDTEKSPLIKECFELYVAGLSTAEIAKTMKEIGRQQNRRERKVGR